MTKYTEKQTKFLKKERKKIDTHPHTFNRDPQQNERLTIKKKSKKKGAI